jgi:hypothetical protein
MDALIIKSENRGDLKLIKELVKKWGLNPGASLKKKSKIPGLHF